MADIEYPDGLIAEARRSWEHIQAGTLTVEIAADVHAAVTAFAEEAKLRRMDVELGLKTLVRHAA
ncbi:hypothetical protein ACWGDS_25945 [Streptomyces sp. NPDC055059]